MVSLDFRWNQSYVVIMGFELWGGGSWEMHFLCHGSLLGTTGDMPPYYSPLFFILVKLTFACDLHIERWPSKGTFLPIPRHTPSFCPHRDRHVPGKPLQKTKVIWKGDLKTCLPIAWWALLSRFVLSAFVHLCESFFFLPEVIKKKKQWRKSEKTIPVSMTILTM